MIVPLLGLAANALLAMGSYGIAGAGLRQPRRLARGLAASVLFWAITTIGLEWLGSVGAIGTYAILVGSAVVAVIGMATRWIRRAVPTGPPATEDAPAGWDAA